MASNSHRNVVELTDSDSDDDDDLGPPPRPPVPPRPPPPRRRPDLDLSTETTVIDLSKSSDDEPAPPRPGASDAAATPSTSRPAARERTDHQSRKRPRTASGAPVPVSAPRTVSPAPVPSHPKGKGRAVDDASPPLPPGDGALAPLARPGADVKRSGGETPSTARPKRPRLDNDLDVADSRPRSQPDVAGPEASSDDPVTRGEHMVIAVASDSEGGPEWEKSDTGDAAVGLDRDKARATDVESEIDMLEEEEKDPPAPGPAPAPPALARVASSQRPTSVEQTPDYVEDLPDFDDMEAAEQAPSTGPRQPPIVSAGPAPSSRGGSRPDPERSVAGPSKPKSGYDNTWWQDLLKQPPTEKPRASPKKSPSKSRPETNGDGNANGDGTAKEGQPSMMREWFAPTPGKSDDLRKSSSPEGKKKLLPPLDLAKVPPRLDGAVPLFIADLNTVDLAPKSDAPPPLSTTNEPSKDPSTTAVPPEAAETAAVPAPSPARVPSPSRKTGMMSNYRPTMRGAGPDASRRVSGGPAAAAAAAAGAGAGGGRTSPTGKQKANLAEAAKRLGFGSSIDKAAGGPVGKVLATMKQVIPANEGLTGGKDVGPSKKGSMGWAETEAVEAGPKEQTQEREKEKQPETDRAQETDKGVEAENQTQNKQGRGKGKEKEKSTLVTTTTIRDDVVVVDDERARSTSVFVPGGAARKLKTKSKKELTFDCLIKNLEWLRAPLHQRALTGPERPLEFNTMVQHTYLTRNSPPITTKAAKSMLRCLIEEDQGRTNPASPAIRIVGDEEIFAPPLEFVYTDRVVYRKGVPAPVRPDWRCDCFGDCADDPSCKCRRYQQEQVRRVKVEDLDTSRFEGFAYDIVPPTEGLPLGAGGYVPPARLKKEVVEFCLPIFECNAQCGCGPECTNRLIGRGRRTLMALKKTAHRGWGVFADQKIQKGDFLIVYSGELLTVDEAERRGEMYDRLIQRTYIFDLDPHWIRSRVGKQDLDGDGFVWLSDVRPNTAAAMKRAVATTAPGAEHVAPAATGGQVEGTKSAAGEQDADEAVTAQYAVDAFHYGNIARFFNHRCEPNVSIIPAYIDEGDIYKPLFALCAAQDVEKGTELTVSYSAPPDSDGGGEGEGDDDGVKADELETDGEPRSAPNQVAQRAGKKVECMCGAPNCRGVMFS